MATNRIYERGTQLEYALADTDAGDPVAIGELPGVALTDTDDDGNVTVQHDGVFELAVVGNDGEAAEISAGDIVYIQSDGTLNIDDSGTRFGYALEDVASGATETIEVKVGY